MNIIQCIPQLTTLQTLHNTSLKLASRISCLDADGDHNELHEPQYVLNRALGKSERAQVWMFPR